MTFPLTTKTLLIVARSNRLLAMDKATGETIAEVKLEDADGESLGTVSGGPLTYMQAGKQHIVVPLTAGRAKASIVALVLR